MTHSLLNVPCGVPVAGAPAATSLLRFDLEINEAEWIGDFGQFRPLTYNYSLRLG